MRLFPNGRSDIMATSSIFANFDIHDTEKAEAFVRALILQRVIYSS